MTPAQLEDRIAKTVVLISKVEKEVADLHRRVDWADKQVGPGSARIWYHLDVECRGRERDLKRLKDDLKHLKELRNAKLLRGEYETD